MQTKRPACNNSFHKTMTRVRTQTPRERDKPAEIPCDFSCPLPRHEDLRVRIYFSLRMLNCVTGDGHMHVHAYTQHAHHMPVSCDVYTAGELWMS